MSGRNIDKLTGARTYEAFTESFDALIAEAGSSGEPISVAMTDIDWFKRVNDEHGIEAGDAVLKAVAKHLKAGSPDGSEVYRYAKDEFLVVMANVEKEQAFLALEKARADFGSGHELDVGDGKIKVSLTLSIGLASYPEDGDRAREIIRKASDALYRAKMSGRNRVALAREERMVTKTSHYTQGQLDRLSQLAKREGVGEAILLREALDDILRKYAV